MLQVKVLTEGGLVVLARAHNTCNPIINGMSVYASKLKNLEMGLARWHVFKRVRVRNSANVCESGTSSNVCESGTAQTCASQEQRKHSFGQLNCEWLINLLIVNG